MKNKLIAAAIAVTSAGLLATTAMAQGPRAASEAYIPNGPAMVQTSQAYATGPRASTQAYIPGPNGVPVSNFSASAMGPRASSEHNIPSHY